MNEPVSSPRPASVEVTIIIPNFRTELLTRFCLRSLRRHTDLNRVRVIVVDNGSADASLDYLRQVEWIELIERQTTGESGPEMHARALDLALERTSSELVLVMHTDTIVVADGWLDFLTSRLRRSPRLAGVGSWKLENTGPIKQFGKKLENVLRRWCGRRINNQEHYLRSHCALYRTALIRQHTNGFFDGDTAGKSLHRKLAAAGYELEFLESGELLRYLRHLNHATMILNPAAGDRKTARPSARKRLARELAKLDYPALMSATELDRKAPAPGR